MRLCSSAGLALQVQHSGSQEEYLHEMVKAALGVAIVGARQPVPAGLVARPLTVVPPRPVVLAAIAGRQQGPSVAAFLKLMRARDWSDADEAEAGAQGVAAGKRADGPMTSAENERRDQASEPMR
jgi:hypothetical protein